MSIPSTSPMAHDGYGRWRTALHAVGLLPSRRPRRGACCSHGRLLPTTPPGAGGEAPDPPRHGARRAPPPAGARPCQPVHVPGEARSRRPAPAPLSLAYPDPPLGDALVALRPWRADDVPAGVMAFADPLVQRFSWPGVEPYT